MHKTDTGVQEHCERFTGHARVAHGYVNRDGFVQAVHEFRAIVLFDGLTRHGFPHRAPFRPRRRQHEGHAEPATGFNDNFPPSNSSYVPTPAPRLFVLGSY
jgi:hypothetical protein